MCGDLASSGSSAGLRGHGSVVAERSHRRGCLQNRPGNGRARPSALRPSLRRRQPACSSLSRKFDRLRRWRVGHGCDAHAVPPSVFRFVESVGQPPRRARRECGRGVDVPRHPAQGSSPDQTRLRQWASRRSDRVHAVGRAVDVCGERLVAADCHRAPCGSTPAQSADRGTGRGVGDLCKPA